MVLCGKFGLPYLDRVQQPQKQRSHSCQCAEFCLCPNNGMAAISFVSFFSDRFILCITSSRLNIIYCLSNQLLAWFFYTLIQETENWLTLQPKLSEHGWDQPVPINTAALLRVCLKFSNEDFPELATNRGGLSSSRVMADTMRSSWFSYRPKACKKLNIMSFFHLLEDFVYLNQIQSIAFWTNKSVQMSEQCVCVFVRACVHACVHACVCVWVCVHVCV